MYLVGFSAIHSNIYLYRHHCSRKKHLRVLLKIQISSQFMKILVEKPSDFGIQKWVIGSIQTKTSQIQSVLFNQHLIWYGWMGMNFGQNSILLKFGRRDAEAIKSQKSYFFWIDWQKIKYFITHTKISSLNQLRGEI